MPTSNSCSGRVLWIVGLVLLAWPARCEELGSCNPDERGTCVSQQGVASLETPASFCNLPTSIYDNGGSAQSYRPGAPLSNEVCRAENGDEYRYKSASWPALRRSMRNGSAPKLDITLKVWSCATSNDHKCACNPMQRATARSASSVVEIWQARPDGLYSPLRPMAPGSDDCRAQVPLTDDGMAKFTTLAPGSTGIMGGLGPGGWDSNPYGPPVIHFLVRAKGHAPLLVDLPVMIHTKTLEPRKFSIGDIRGVAWARKAAAELPMKIRSWTANVPENKISLELDVYLQPSYQDQPEFCSHYLYEFPSSFFLEPMSVCAPSMLDFFAL